MNLARSELQSLSEAKAASTHVACLPAHACWQLCPPALDTSWIAGGSGGAGGTGTCGRPSCAAGAGGQGRRARVGGSAAHAAEAARQPQLLLHLQPNPAWYDTPGLAAAARPTFEKQCLRAAMNAFSCCVERAVVRHTARQYWNGVSHLPVSGLRGGGVGWEGE